MKTSNTRTTWFSSTVGKIVMALVFASMIGGISGAPAFGQEMQRSDRQYHRDRYNSDRHYRDHRRVYYQNSRSYYYTERVYVPPPVVYAPAPYQSPGISIVFPID
ncbi:MAG: hypothetical protein HQK60_13645 [Deltaproteobacteria bacterium]|nr:hypothetical protein [Deltaproteobacteria bacterium]